MIESLYKNHYKEIHEMGNPQPSPKFIFIFFKKIRYKYGCSSETKWKLALYYIYIILCLRYSPFQLERVVLRRNVL
jgi:hypothetical protein